MENLSTKFIVFLVCLLFISIQVFGEIDSSVTIFERILTSNGVSLTFGEDFSDVGLGVDVFRTIVFLDGEDMNGLYIPLFLPSPSIRITHVNDVQITDLRLAGIGYRGESPIKNLGFNASFSAAVGQRRIENTVYGDWYWGISPEVGLYFPHNSPIDFEILFSPMIHIYNMGGEEIINKTYYDIHFLVNFKDFFRKFQYIWSDEEG